MDFLYLISASSVIIFPLIFLVVFQISAKLGMSISYFITIILAFLVWGVNINTICASSFEGFIKALSIIWILFGAIFLLNILRKSGAIDIIISGFENLTSDKRLQLIIIGFFFVALLEGASGFGAPAAIAAPLLVVLGFNPIAAASLSLIGNVVPMTFGAVGTPIIDGMGGVLNAIDSDFIHQVSINCSYIDLFVGSFIPVLMVILYTTIFTRKKSLSYKLELLPFALISGFVYTSIAYLSTVFIGPEFGALIGALLGLVIIMTMISKNILIPKVSTKNKSNIPFKIMVKSWLPYLLVVLLLISTRLILPLKIFLKSLIIHFDNILNTKISAKFDIFYSPGFILTLCAVLVILFYRLNKEDVKWAFGATMISAKKTTYALVPALAAVYVFLNSNINDNQLMGMPNYIANTLSNIFRDKWLFVSPYLGNLGTFIAGSTTTSNIMFSEIQYEVALHNNIAPLKVLTAQALGANTGAMISVSKVVSACAVVNLSGKESKVMRITLLVSLIHALIIGLVISSLL